MLGAPGDSARKRGRRRAGARIMREFGGQAIDSIAGSQVERWLETLDADDISKRTVNTYRQLVCSVLEHAARRPERYGLSTNVARLTPKRREPDPGVLDFYEPEEVAALARAARAGAHRDPSRPAVCRRRSTSAGEPTTRTQRCSSLPPSRGCAWGSCWSRAGAASASSARP